MKPVLHEFAETSKLLDVMEAIRDKVKYKVSIDIFEKVNSSLTYILYDIEISVCDIRDILQENEEFYETYGK